MKTMVRRLALACVLSAAAIAPAVAAGDNPTPSDPPELPSIRAALKAHRAMSCSGYSRSDFIISEKGPIFLETNTLPGLTKASLYPKALKAQGIEFADFLKDQIALAEKRVRK